MSGLVVAFFAATQLAFVLVPVTRTQKVRQADTAAVSRNLAFEAPDVLRPRIDMRGDLTGITGMEFPAFQAVVALVMRALGTDADQVGKAVALAATLGAFWAIASVLVRRFGVHAGAAYGALAVSPLLFGYGSRFMPESFGLMLGAIAVDRFDAWWDRRGSSRLLTAGAAIMLAALVRPYVAFVALTMVVGAVTLARRRDPAALAVAALGACALVPFAVWYFWWVPHLVRAYGINYFFMGYPLRSNLAAMGRGELWATLVFVIAQEIFSWQLLPVAALGVFALRRRVRGRADAGIWWTTLAGVPVLTILGLLILTGHHFWPHDYYLIALVPSAALVVASGFDEVRLRWPRAFVPLVAAGVVALPITLAHQFRRDPEVDRFASVVPRVAANVAPGDLVAVEGTELDSWRLNAARCRGWVVPHVRLVDRAHMADLGRRGCRWVISEDGAEYRLDRIDQWAGRLASREDAQTAGASGL